ncbi:proline-rich receptor-like protein kinase PERK9 [Drosophila ficusphila]|uniref:proline-rich receptor-like protein kinase PERK9 n=1 Tax=Drosophila ficusphila TaxID=30025 RepID=UPI0007E78F7B|nr:proline-rich receptor-like protein kinase PERK9 [Drosophila ficusphila]
MMGNNPSSTQVARRPPDCRCDDEVFHGSHRNPERNRSRHCFVVRSQKPAHRFRLLNAETGCCCSPPPLPLPLPPPPPPPPVTSSAGCRCALPPKPRHRCCCSSPPEPVRQRACRSSGNEGVVGRVSRRPKVCHPDAYPVALHPRTAVVPEGALFPEAEPPVVLPRSVSAQSLQPAVQALKGNCQQPPDPYYPHPPRTTRMPEVDPLVNFDLNRFDRDATHRGPGGRRRNVSIRTCVDYDYEPQYPSRERSHPPRPGPLEFPSPPLQGPSGYTSHPPIVRAPRTRSPQRSYQPRGLPESYDHAEIEHVKCPYR